MKSEIRLFSYKLTNDSGFAPNPFGGVMTLATCKPKIREHKHPGDWIAGFTSGTLNGDTAGNERLIYLMQVTDKILISDYWNNPLYEYKKPLADADKKRKFGDNIYKPLRKNAELPEDFKQITNISHQADSMMRDLSGKYVLISDKFWYFGCKPLEIPAGIRPEIPAGQSSHGSMTHDIKRAEEFISFIQTGYKKGVHGNPLSWKSHETGCCSK
jgi:hypothetical protein